MIRFTAQLYFATGTFIDDNPIDQCQHKHNLEHMTLDSKQALDNFLSGVERRAFRMAEIATGNPDDALDLVQEAMMVLVKNYAHTNEQDWGPLFHRILQNRIRDWYRRNSVRNKLRGWLGITNNNDEHIDPIQSAIDHQGKSPEDMVRNSDTGEALHAALKLLPLRQQQAFLLRNWEGMNVKQTAETMTCSEGSVKTHYSRAIHRLRVVLEEHYEPNR